MIDPVSAFAALSAGHSAIMKGIQMGKDLSKLSNAVSRYAQGEAELQFGAAQKKKSRFSLAEDSAIERHFRKEKLEDMRNELRSIFQLYGKAGQWERLQAEIASERARIQKELNLKAHKKEQLQIWCTFIAMVVVGGGGFLWYVLWLRGLL
jgi:septum formation topological specificity factor MinE